MVSQKEMIEGVKAHAMSHYTEGNWDYVVETYTDAEIAEEIKGCRTVNGAIRRMARLGRILADNDKAHRFD